MATRRSTDLQSLSCGGGALAILTVLMVLFPFGSPSQAGTVTFFDGTFNDGDWSATKVTDTTPGQGATFSAGQETSGGNPGEFRRTVMSWAGGAIEVGHLRSGAFYDPGDGPITTLDFSFDLKRPSAPGINFVAYDIVLFQSNSYYSTPVINFNNSGWQNFTEQGLTASDFQLKTGLGPANPDFSVGGGLIQFGYLTNNSTGPGHPPLVSTSDIDNWSVTLETQEIPEPTTILLLGTGLVGLIGYGRRRKRSV